MTDPNFELSELLSSERTPSHLKYSALKYILGITASEEGLQLIVTHKDYLNILYNFLACESQHEICQTAHNCFINISAVPQGAMAIIGTMQNFSDCVIARLDDRECLYLEPKCQILANVTRCQAACEVLALFFKSAPSVFGKLMFHYMYNDFELKTKYDYLGLMFGNLSACVEGKRLFINASSPYIKYILPYTAYPDSEVRRMGAAILLKNICFEIDYFKYFLEDVEILSAILLPLIGPEDFDEDEMDKFPPDLQFLGDDKQREVNPHLRLLFLEALFKLCSTKYSRIYLRQKGVYYILREFHKWETFPPALRICEDIVEVLIRDEEDVDVDNLMDLTIPEHLAKKFEELSVSTSEVPEIIV